MRWGLCKTFSQIFCCHHPETLKGIRGDYTGVASIFMHALSGISSNTCVPSFLLSLLLCLPCVAWLTVRKILQLQEK